MPHGIHFPITPVLSHVARMQPQTVLDVGVGYGKWGFLLREMLDWLPDRHEKVDWQAQIDGIEIFEGYTSPMYDWVYDKITYGDIRELAATLPAYDVIVMGDVIEHLTKEDGLAVLRTLLAKSRNVVIATPSEFYTQSTCENPAEQHLSLWGIQDFTDWTTDFEVVGGNTVVAALAGAGATYPTKAMDQASRLAYRLPMVDRTSLGPQLVKAVSRRAYALRG